MKTILKQKDAQIGDYITAVMKLDFKIRTQNAINIEQNNKLDDLALKGGELSLSKSQNQKAQIALLHTEINQKDDQIYQLTKELKRAIQSLKEFKDQIQKLDKFLQEESLVLEDKIAYKLNDQNTRIKMVTESFEEALQLSNKTYFLEEVTKLKQDKKKLIIELKLLKEKLDI